MITLRKFSTLLALALGLSLPSTMLGCKPDTPAEEVGEGVEDVLDGRDTPAENAGERIEDTADDVGEAVQEGAQNVENRVENIGDNDMN